jgi:hypothetical protein
MLKLELLGFLMDWPSLKREKFKDVAADGSLDARMILSCDAAKYSP